MAPAGPRHDEGVPDPIATAPPAPEPTSGPAELPVPTLTPAPPPAPEPTSGAVAIMVRTATADDAAEVAALVHTAYRSDASRTGWTTEADLVGGQRADVAMVGELVDRAGSVVLVGVTLDGADHGRADLLACCHLERREGSAGLGLFAVVPGRQGRGVGRAMLSAAERYAQDEWGVTVLELTVLNHRPELIAWYQRCGFVETGEQHPFPYGDERFGTPHRQDLLLVAMAKDIVAAPITGAPPARGTGWGP